MTYIRACVIGFSVLFVWADLAGATVDIRPVNLSFTPPESFTGFDPDAVDPIDVGVTVDVEEVGNGMLPSFDVDIQVNQSSVFMWPMVTGTQSLQTTLMLKADDYVEVVVDPGNAVEEIIEDNNALGFKLGHDASNKCDPYPGIISFLDPEDPAANHAITMECESCSAHPSQAYPYALLILPPWDETTSNPGGAMETSFTQTTTYTDQTEDSIGVTAGVAIEVEEPPIDIGAKSGWGVGVQTALEQATGVTTERTRSQQFSAMTTAGVGPASEATVVLVRTLYDVCEYNITNAYDPNRKGHKAWIGAPQSDAPGPIPLPNPVLTQVPFHDYAAAKSPDAPLLVDPHVYGSMTNWPHGPHSEEHLDGVLWTATSDKLITGAAQLISTGGAHWSETLEQGNLTTQSVELGVDYHSKGEFAGVTVESSFGVMSGSTHTVYEGLQSGFDWKVGPVNSLDDEYIVYAYAANADVLYRLCPTPPPPPFPDGCLWSGSLLVVDYYVGACAQTPEADCLEAGKGSSLVVADHKGKETLSAKWRRGPELIGTDFGNPLESMQTAYHVCIYNEAEQLAGAYMVARAGDTCGSKPCWKNVGKAPGNPKHKGYKYIDKEAEADGVRRMKLSAGSAGKSKAFVAATNDLLAGAPVRATGVAGRLLGSHTATLQLFVDSSAPKCISASLTADVLHNGPEKFKASAPAGGA